MSRLTINLPDDLHRALKERAARSGSTIGEIIAESLDLYGIKPEADVLALLERAREHSGLSDDEAEQLALEETRTHRKR